jgi:hypothetical protein
MYPDYKYLRNKFIFFCGWKYRVAHDAKFPSFFWMDTPSTNKTNKFIPYHLILLKHRYYGIKRYISYDLFMHCMFCDV